MTTDHERKATERARFLERDTELNRREAEVLAWSELGYSHGGIAKRTERSDGTVNQYLDRIAARYGLEAILTKNEFEVTASIDPVPPEYHMSLATREHQRTWLTKVASEKDALPDSWVAKVTENAADDGFGPILTE